MLSCLEKIPAIRSEMEEAYQHYSIQLVDADRLLLQTQVHSEFLSTSPIEARRARAQEDAQSFVTTVMGREPLKACQAFRSVMSASDAKSLAKQKTDSLRRIDATIRSINVRQAR